MTDLEEYLVKVILQDSYFYGISTRIYEFDKNSLKEVLSVEGED